MNKLKINKNFFQKIGKVAGQKMTRFAQFKWVQVIKDTGLVQMPFMLIGSLFLIAKAITQMTTHDYANSYLGRSMFDTIMNMGNALSFGLAGLIGSFCLGYFASRIVKPTKMKMIPVNGGIMSLITFIILVSVVRYSPANFVSGENAIVTFVEGKYDWSVNISKFGPQSFFTVILSGVFSHYVLYLFYKYNIGIRLPKSVPEFVTNAFNVILAGFFVVVSSIGVVHALAVANTSVNLVLQKAFDFLVNIGTSWYGMYLAAFFIMLAWFFGIHGGITVQALVAPTWTAALAQNQNGATNIFAQGFKDYYMNAGGLACILCLAIMMSLFAKSKKLKAIGSSSIIPGTFNISEPVVFGTPLIYNPFTAIPFFLIPIVNITIGGIFSINEWFSSVPKVQVHWAIPAPIQAFLGTLSWQSVIVVLIIWGTSILIWFPFFKKYDAAMVKEEQNGSSGLMKASEEKVQNFKAQKIKQKENIEKKTLNKKGNNSNLSLKDKLKKASGR